MKNNLSVSQNFLQDKKQITKILKKIEFDKTDLILDIGVGEGIISQTLLENNFKVLGFELDTKLYKNLFLISQNPKFKLKNEDFLDFNLKSLKDIQFSIFSNIPFNLTTNIVQKILIKEPYAQKISLIMQEEAANRFLGKKEGLLVSLLIKNNYKAEIIYKFKKTDFFPVPKVNIVMAKFTKRDEPLIKDSNYSNFLNFISYIIMQQKPTIIDRLAKTHNYYALREFLNELKIQSFNSLYQIPGEKYFEMFNLFYKKFPAKTKIFENSYQNYLKINQKNQKVYKTRTQ